MRGEHNELKVGITVTVVTVIFVIILGFIGKWDMIFAKTRTIQVRFPATVGIQNLRDKDPVRIAGMNIGRVLTTRLQTDKVVRDGKSHEEMFAYVLAEIPADIKLYNDAKVSIGTKFVGEGATLDVLDPGWKGKLLTSTEVINGVAPATIADITAKVNSELDQNNPDSLIYQIKSQLDVKNKASLISKIHLSMQDVNAVTSEIRLQLTDAQKDTLLRKLQEVMDNVNATTATLRKEMNKSEPEMALAKIHKVLDSLNIAMTSARNMMQETGPRVTSIAKTVDGELNKKDPDSLLSKLRNSMDAAHAGMENIKTLTQVGKDLFVLNRDNLQEIIDNFAETSAHLEATAKEIRRNPWRLLYKPDKPEAEYANLMESARAFSDAALAMEEANSKLKTLMAMHPDKIDPNDPMLIKIREEVKKAFCNFEQAQKKLYEILKQKS
jgi:ABC-type transporter Mla subunit MlaD